MKTTMMAKALGVLWGLFAASCSGMDEMPGVQASPPAGGEHSGSPAASIGDEDAAALALVPQPAKDAALARVPGLVLSEAEVEGDGVYCLHGMADGVFYEVEVDAEGKVLEVERGDDDDDDDADDDDEGEADDEDDD
jgi:uncharacterized membrane protein YkoI